MRRRYWVLLIVVVLGIAVFTVLFLQSQKVGTVNPEFLSARNDIARLIRDLAAMPDLDLAVLSPYDIRRDARGALSALDALVKQNESAVRLMEQIQIAERTFRVTSGKLSVPLATHFSPLIANLEKGNVALTRYFAIRAQLLGAFQQYYRDSLSGKKVVPLNIQLYIREIDARMQEAQLAYQEFGNGIIEFDREAGIK